MKRITDMYMYYYTSVKQIRFLWEILVENTSLQTIDTKFAYPNNPDGWRLSGMWGKHVCVVGIQLQGRKCKQLTQNLYNKASNVKL